MKKKIFALAVIAALQMNVYAATKISPECSGNKLNITIDTAYESGKTVSVSVLKNGESKQAENAFAVEEVKVGDDKKIKFTLEIPENRSGVSSNGAYTVYVMGTEAGEFDFTGEDTRRQFVEFLAGAISAEDIYDALENNNDYKVSADNLGIKAELYNLLTAAEKNEFAARIASAAKSEATVIRQCQLLLAEKITANHSEHTSAALEMLNNEYNSVKYKDITDSEQKAFIDNYIKAQKPSADKFDDEYTLANVLYKLNKARYNEVLGYISNNGALLGITADSAYVQFNGYTDASKIAVCENIVRQLSQKSVSTKEEFAAVFAKAVSETPNTNTAGGGGSTGGGGSSGNSSKSSAGSSSNGTVSTITGTTVTEEDFVFDDVKNSWAKEAVTYLYKKGIVSGVNKNEFCPSNNVTREEFITMLMKSQTSELNGICKFSDVTEDAWYYPYVATAFERGIVYGISEDTFGIGNYITRQDMMVMIARVLTDDKNGIRTADELSDFDAVSDYAKEAVKTLYEKGIVSGNENKMIEPMKYTTRAEAAQLIYNIVKK